MRTITRLWVLALAAGCWLAGGPGGVTLQAIARCLHHPVTHAGHGSSVPSEGPCFCDKMTGGSDVAVSAAVPAPVGPDLVVTPPAVDLPFPLPASSFPAFSPAPEPPPPNPLA